MVVLGLDLDGRRTRNEPSPRGSSQPFYTVARSMSTQFAGNREDPISYGDALGGKAALAPILERFRFAAKVLDHSYFVQLYRIITRYVLDEGNGRPQEPRAGRTLDMPGGRGYIRSRRAARMESE
jgi:hypothetical protein